jgi:hypothetical protein
MKTITKTLRLTVLVTFESPDKSDFETFRQNLLDIPQNAASRGLMSQESEEGTVTSWEATVDTVFASAPGEHDEETPAPRTLYRLVKNGLFYRAGKWVEDGGELFDLTDERLTGLLVEQHGGRFYPVENCVRD